MAIRYVNDAPTLADGFGTTIAGDQVARMALEAATPFTLGVTGKWGAGKTSVLRRAFFTLKGNQPQGRCQALNVRIDTDPIPLHLTRQELADLTGTTVETCIWIMSRWGKDGLVQTEKDGFLVVDCEALGRDGAG